MKAAVARSPCQGSGGNALTACRSEASGGGARRTTGTARLSLRRLDSATRSRSPSRQERHRHRAHPSACFAPQSTHRPSSARRARRRRSCARWACPQSLHSLAPSRAGRFRQWTHSPRARAAARAFRWRSLLRYLTQRRQMRPPPNWSGDRRRKQPRHSRPAGGSGGSRANNSSRPFHTDSMTSQQPTSALRSRPPPLRGRSSWRQQPSACRADTTAIVLARYGRKMISQIL